MDIKKIFKEKSLVNLDISIGHEVAKGYLTLEDIGKKFYEIPYSPIPDGSLDLIKAANVLEKIDRREGKFIEFMDEMWRMLKIDGQLAIASAYAGSYLFYQDPMNINPMNEATFAYFDPLEAITGGNLYKVYKPKPWKIQAMTFAINGIIEVVLGKRIEDISYGR